MIALFNRDDSYHAAMVDFLKSFRGRLFSTWPVLTEVTHMLDFNPLVQIDFLSWIADGAVTLINLEPPDMERIIELAKKYADLPMDLADGSLLAIAKREKITSIITIASDYYMYRMHNKKALKNLFRP